MPVAYRYSIFFPGYARPRVIEACILIGIIGTMLGVSSTMIGWAVDTEPAFLDYTEHASITLILAVWLRVLILWKTQHAHAKKLLEQEALPCVRCGYPLRDQQRPRCTECGHKHERTQTIRHWRDLGILSYPSWLHTQGRHAPTQGSQEMSVTDPGTPHDSH